MKQLGKIREAADSNILEALQTGTHVRYCPCGASHVLKCLTPPMFNEIAFVCPCGRPSLGKDLEKINAD